NLIWPPALAVLLLLARRWRETVAFGIGLLPALGTLALWKYRGFGYVPAFAYHETRMALGSGTLLDPYYRYVHINWHQLHINQLQLAEFFFSVRVLEVAPVVRPLKGPHTSIQVRRIATLVDGSLDLQADVRGRAVHLRWRPSGGAGTAVFYRLSRSPGRTDVACEFRPGAADECLARTVPLRTLRRTSAVDGPG